VTANLTLTYGALNLTASPYLVPFGTDLGSPQNEANPLAFLLQDGEIELSSRASNRTIVFDVLIEGASLTALATAEAALVAETEKVLNTLTVDPGDGAPATVFEIFRGQVSLLRDDTYELARMRRYTVTVRALPFPRSAAETVTSALAASGSTTTLVNDGSATTNWTGSVSAGVLTGPTVVSGAVKVGTNAALTGDVTVSAILTASITTSSTKFLPVDWKPESPAGSPTIRAFGDGVELTKFFEGPSPTAGFTRTYFGPVTASSIAVLRLDSRTNITSVYGFGTAAVRSLYIDNINRTDVRPAIGTTRQQLRSIDVGGTERAPGCLAVEHASSALGDVLVYVFPDSVGTQGYSPPLRQYLTTTAGTADSTLVSGAKNDIKSGFMSFDVPLNRLADGLHLLEARVLTTGTLSAAIQWTAQAFVNSTGVGTQQTGTLTTTAPYGMTILPLGRVLVPGVDIDPAVSNAVMRITLNGSGGASTIVVDEAWLFNIDVGQLIGPVVCGTASPASGGAANRLFIESPSTLVPRPTIRIGFAADRSDSFYPASLGGWQQPLFYPSRANILTVTTNAQDASATFRAFRRWHTNAAS
jgi:hypothetical protein